LHEVILALDYDFEAFSGSRKASISEPFKRLEGNLPIVLCSNKKEKREKKTQRTWLVTMFFDCV
jgi:hypothetical protein